MATREEDSMSLCSLKSGVSGLFSVGWTSQSTLINEEGYVPRKKLCLVGNNISVTLEGAAQESGLEVVRSSKGLEYLDDPTVCFVLMDFDREEWGRLFKIKWRVLGAAVVVASIDNNLPLPVALRPLYSLTMKGVVTCFTGIRSPEVAKELMFLIRAMGGSVRETPNRETTHLISATTKGKKYEYAVIFIVPIMSIEWVRQCWRLRNDLSSVATDEHLMQYRLPPFVDVFAAFIGFPSDELDDMAVALKRNGGQFVETSSALCTHIVADDLSPVSIPAGANREAVIVRAEWFWSCIQQVNRLQEEDYKVATDRFRRPPQRCSKYLRCNPNLGSGQDDDAWHPVNAVLALRKLWNTHKIVGMRTVRSNRRRSIGDVRGPGGSPNLAEEHTRTVSACRLHLPEQQPSTKRGTPSPSHPDVFARLYADASKPKRTCAGCRVATSPDAGSAGKSARGGGLPVSQRFGAFFELMHTEENYVGILDTLLQMRSEALATSQAGGALLSQTEAKMIFGALMPISRTHHAILKDLRCIFNNWKETASIGEVFQKYSSDLLRGYVPFVSSFEDAKEAIERASERNPRFHAFLKVCKGRPECGRQDLRDLMIRPVQRLGSCKLLLREILKHTPAGCSDRKQIESAIESLAQVLSLINEDKRKMESMIKLFGIYSLTDGCPAHVIASHRSLIVEFEGVEVTEQGFGKPGNTIAIFVFTDIILVCKKKSRVVAMTKGRPGSDLPRRVLKHVGGKPYKFLQLLPLSAIRKIVDVADGGSVANAVGLVLRGKTEMRESCSYLQLADGGVEKAQLVGHLSGALASHNCVADPAMFVNTETAEEAGILDATEYIAKQFNKAAQMAVKTQSIMTSALGLGRSLSDTSKSKTNESSSCAMSSCNSMSQLETMKARLEVLYEDENEDEEEKPKPASLTAKIMKRM